MPNTTSLVPESNNSVNEIPQATIEQFGISPEQYLAQLSHLMSNDLSESPTFVCVYGGTGQLVDKTYLTEKITKQRDDSGEVTFLTIVIEGRLIAIEFITLEAQ